MALGERGRKKGGGGGSREVEVQAAPALALAIVRGASRGAVAPLPPGSHSSAWGLDVRALAPAPATLE